MTLPRDPASTDRLTTGQKRDLLKALLEKRLRDTAPEFALSYGQRALWFLNQLNPDMSAYNIVIAAEATPGLDLERLQRALRLVIARHPALRTTFRDIDGVPVQRVSDAGSASLSVIDVAGAPHDEVVQAMKIECERRFDLAMSPMRAVVFRSPLRDILVVTVHHIVFDAASAPILLSDLRTVYEAFLADREPRLPPMHDTYRDFVRWQEEVVGSSRGAEMSTYWTERLSGDLPVLQLASARPRRGMASYKGGSIPFRIDRGTRDGVYALARERRVTPVAVLLAAYATLLHRLADQREVIIGMPVSGRNHPRWTGVVGYFVNMMPLRLQFDDGCRFSDLVGQASEELRNGLAHQDFPFLLMRERLRAKRAPKQAPIFQTVLNVHLARQGGEFARLFDFESNESVRFGASFLKGVPLPQQEGQFDVSAELFDPGDQLIGTVKYAADILEPTDAERIAASFSRLLDQAVANPAARPADYAIEGSSAGPIDEDREHLVI